MSKRARAVLISLSSLVVMYALFGALLGKDGDTRKTYRNLGVYSEVLLRIKGHYVVEPDLRKTTRGALRGLLESLDRQVSLADAAHVHHYIDNDFQYRIYCIFEKHGSIYTCRKLYRKTTYHE